MKKILIVANLSKEHILKFHIPTIKELKTNGWVVDVACAGLNSVPFCDNQFQLSNKRKPISIKNIVALKELTKIINCGNYNVIYCNTPVGGTLARLASRKIRKKGAKIIYFAHGFHFYKGAPLKNWILYYPVEKILSRLTDIIFTINEEDYKIASLKFHRISYLFPGVGVNFERLNKTNKNSDRKQIREKYNIPMDAKVLIYVAELIKNKNQTMIFKAMKKCEKNIYLFLVGPDYTKGKYRKIAKKAGLEDRVVFTGWMDNISVFLNASDICVASSIREGFGINLVESMFCGLPIVATENRGHKTIIRNGENGYLVKNSDEMAEKINELVTKKEMYLKFSNIDVSEYDSNKVARRIVGVIEKECL